MKLNYIKKWSIYLTLVVLLTIYLVNPVLLQIAKLNTFDSYQKFGKNYESKSLVLLDISDQALKKQGQWPWKRDILGRTIINAYKNGERDNAIMNGFAATLSEQDILDISKYFSEQKGLKVLPKN